LSVDVDSYTSRFLAELAQTAVRHLNDQARQIGPVCRTFSHASVDGDAWYRDYEGTLMVKMEILLPETEEPQRKFAAMFSGKARMQRELGEDSAAHDARLLKVRSMKQLSRYRKFESCTPAGGRAEFCVCELQPPSHSKQ
jgi:hypothetical protein